MKPNNNFNLTHSLLQTVREVVAGERSIAVRDVAAAAALERKRLRHSLRQKSAPRAKEPTVMISHGKGGGVKVIPKSQYNPKKHDLADEKEPMAAPVAKVDAKKMDRRKVIAKTIEKKKNGIKLSGKAEFVDVRPKMNEAHGEWEAQREFPGRDAFIVKAPDGKTYRVINGQSNGMAIRIAKSKRYSGEVKAIKKLNKEETEQNKSVDEEVEQVDEISKATLRSYLGKSRAQQDDIEDKHDSDPSHHRTAAGRKDMRTSSKRYSGEVKAIKKLNKEEAEQVDELSKATLGSYIKKASHDVSSTSAHSGRYREKATHHTNNAKSNPPPARVKIDHAWHAAWALHRKHAAAARDAHKVADKHFEKSWARSQGIAKATDKLIKKEEVEQVDEISRGLASRYIAKTKDSSSRKAGRALALKKKWGDKNYGTPEPRVKATEEVEQVDEISKATLGSYVKKASHDAATKSAATGRYGERSREHTKNAKSGPAHAYWGDTMAARDADKVADKFFKKSWARRQGIAKATDKLTKT